MHDLSLSWPLQKSVYHGLAKGRAKHFLYHHPILHYFYSVDCRLLDSAICAGPDLLDKIHVKSGDDGDLSPLLLPPQTRGFGKLIVQSQLWDQQL